MTDQPDTAARILGAVETALGDQLTPTARAEALDSIRRTLSDVAAPAARDAELERLRAELAALRQVARGYCPHCGRGDCAPRLEDWERERQRAEQAEAAIARVRKAVAERRTEVAEYEAENPPSAWSDAVTVTCDRIDDALRTPAASPGMVWCPAEAPDALNPPKENQP